MPALSLPIILIGPMGSGKTTVGRHLAQRLEANYVDTDDLFVAEHGHIGQFFTTHGETAFRDNEQQVIAQTLARDDLGVISLGGGAIIRLANREIIRERGYVAIPRRQRIKSPQSARRCQRSARVGRRSSRSMVADPGR